jgi:hypothetical protein
MTQDIHRIGDHEPPDGPRPYALVVVESVFGNTRRIGESVAEGIREHLPTLVRGAAELTAEELIGATLLVVGGPTHAHGMATEATRSKGAAQGGTEAQVGPLLRDWLAPLRATGSAAAFDTRLARNSLITGSAARAAARMLKHAGYTLVATPESFLVEGPEGPLRRGETDRAQAWGWAMGEVVAQQVGTPQG